MIIKPYKTYDNNVVGVVVAGNGGAAQLQPPC